MASVSKAYPRRSVTDAPPRGAQTAARPRPRHGLDNRELAALSMQAAPALEPRPTAPEPQQTRDPAAASLSACGCASGPTHCPRCRAASLAPMVRRRRAAAGAERAPRITGTQGPASVAPALGGARALSRAERSFFEPRFGLDLSAVRLHTDTQAARSATALDARAFSIGSQIAFAAGQYQPDSLAGRELLAHELAHVVLGHADIRRSPPSPDPDRADDEPLGPSPDDAQDAFNPVARRRFAWTVSSAMPDAVTVPADATRDEIALALFNDGTKRETFYYVSGSETYGDGGDDQSRLIRFYDPAAAPPAVQQAARDALETRLPHDVQDTVKQLIAGASGEALAGRVLRWSQYSEFKDTDGVSYFERYLKALEAVQIRTSKRVLGYTYSTSTRNALEDILAELSDRPLEMVRKAITLRSERDVGYTVEDAGPKLAPGDAVGRWFSNEDDSAIRMTVATVVADCDTRAEAEIRTRSSGFLGARVVVPAADGRFYGYGVVPYTSMGAAIPGRERGQYAWYYPGTILVGAGDFEPSGFELTADRGFAVYMVREALNKTTAHNASALYGLDYGVLALATPDDRIDLFKRVLDSGSIGDPAAVAMLTRAVLTMRPEQFRAFERRLDREGVTARLLGTRDSKLRGLLGQLGQAFTMQAMAAGPLGANAFAEPTTLELGEGEFGTSYIQAEARRARSHLVPADQWDPSTTVTAHGDIREPGLPGEAEGDIDRTTIRFTHGSVPDAYSLDTPRWNRRSADTTRAFLPTELLSLETMHKGKRSRRVVSAFEAALMQGDPQGDASGKDLSDFLDTLMLVQAGFGLARLGGTFTRAAAASSLRAGVAVLAEELSTQAGKAALRSVADYALLQAAHYALAHQEELEKAPQGRLFMSLTTAAIALLAARDIGHLAESGLLTRVVAAGREALGVVGDIARAAVARTMRDFRAAQMAWSSLREAGALEMVTVNGLRVVSPSSMAEFGQAFRVAQGRAAGEGLLETMRAAGQSTRRAESVLADLEKAAGGTRGARTEAQKEAARAYRDVAEAANRLPPDKIDGFLKSIEDTLGAGRRSSADLAPALRAAARAPNPLAALADLQWLAKSDLSQEAFTVMSAKVGRGSVDLGWLRTTQLSKESLEFLARDPNTPWNLFRDAARNPSNTALQLRAMARLRGASAEMVAGEHATTLVPGWRTKARQVPMGESEIDFSLQSTDRLGRSRGLEVKGWTRDTWKESIEAYPLRSRARSSLSDEQQRAIDRIEHMIGQLKDAANVARSETPVLAVTKGIRADDLAELRRIIARRVDRPVEIVLLDEASITQRGAVLRSGLGIPGPQ